MIQFTREEHATALFVIAMYYWYLDDKMNARSAIEVAVQVAGSYSLGDA